MSNAQNAYRYYPNYIQARTDVSYHYSAQQIQINIPKQYQEVSFPQNIINLPAHHSYNQSQSDNSDMFVSFCSESKQIFETQAEIIDYTGNEQQSDQVEIKQEQEQSQLKEILRESRELNADDYSDDQYHVYRSQHLQNDISMRLNPEEIGDENQNNNEMKQQKDESYELLLKPKDRDRIVPNMEISQSLYYYKQVIFVVFEDYWHKLEVDLKSYPKTWTINQLAETLILLFSEDVNRSIDVQRYNLIFRFFRYEAQTKKEEIIDLNLSDTVQSLRNLVDFSYSLDYFWLKIQ